MVKSCNFHPRQDIDTSLGNCKVGLWQFHLVVQEVQNWVNRLLSGWYIKEGAHYTKQKQLQRPTEYRIQEEVQDVPHDKALIVGAGCQIAAEMLSHVP